MPRMPDIELHLTTLEQIVYEAITEPRSWERFADEANAALGVKASALAIRRKRDLALVEPVAATWDEQAGSEYVSHFHAMDVVTPQLASVPLGSPFILEELIELPRFERTPFFNDWANKHKVAFLAGITFEIDKEHIGALSFHRENGWNKLNTQEFEFIRRIAVPLRFALGQRRLTKELMTAQGSLDRLSIGVVHLDEQGRVAWCNSRAEEILRIGDGLIVKHQRLHATRDDVNAELESKVHDTLQGDVSPRGVDMVIPRSANRPALHIVAVPLGGEFSISVLGEYVPTAIFINDMTDPEGYETVLRHAWKLVFNLTDIQAGIACQLVEGAKYKELVTSKRNEETIRSHIKAIYARTNVSTRAELQKLARQLVMQLRWRRLGNKRRK